MRAHCIGAHRPSDVLELPLPQVLERQIEPPGGIFLNAGRHAEPTRFSQSFEPRRDVHAIAKNIAIFDDNIADVDANSKLNALVLRHSSISFSHAGLDLAGAAQRIHDTTEFDEQPIARRLHEPAVVRGDRRIDQLIPDRLEPSQSAALVSSHQSGVTGYISSEDRSETAGLAH